MIQLIVFFVGVLGKESVLGGGLVKTPNWVSLAWSYRKSPSSKAKALGVKVYAYDKYHQDFNDEFALEVDLFGLLQRAHVVSLHRPLRRNKVLCRRQLFVPTSTGTMLINTSRGSMIAR